MSTFATSGNKSFRKRLNPCAPRTPFVYSRRTEWAKDASGADGGDAGLQEATAVLPRQERPHHQEVLHGGTSAQMGVKSEVVFTRLEQSHPLTGYPRSHPGPLGGAGQTVEGWAWRGGQGQRRPGWGQRRNISKVPLNLLFTLKVMRHVFILCLRCLRPAGVGRMNGDPCPRSRADRVPDAAVAARRAAREKARRRKGKGDVCFPAIYHHVTIPNRRRWILTVWTCAGFPAPRINTTTSRRRKRKGKTSEGGVTVPDQKTPVNKVVRHKYGPFFFLFFSPTVTIFLCLKTCRVYSKQAVVFDRYGYVTFVFPGSFAACSFS